jgi:hypothetical protein
MSEYKGFQVDGQMDDGCLCGFQGKSRGFDGFTERKVRIFNNVLTTYVW